MHLTCLLILLLVTSTLASWAGCPVENTKVGNLSFQATWFADQDEWNSSFHSISGDVCIYDEVTLTIRDFWFDGQEPAVFLIGTTSTKPSSQNATILPFPFKCKFYDYPQCDEEIERIPKLIGPEQSGAFIGHTIGNKGLALRLPHPMSVTAIKWISVWGFSHSYADLMFNQTQLTIPAATNPFLYTDTKADVPKRCPVETGLPRIKTTCEIIQKSGGSNGINHIMISLCVPLMLTIKVLI